MADRISRLSVEQKLPLLVGALLLAVMAAIVVGAYTQIRRVAVGTASDRLMTVTAQLRDMFQQSAVPLRAASAASASRTLGYTGPSKEQIVATQLRDSSGAVLSAAGPWAAMFDTLRIDRMTAARDSVTIGDF